MPTATLKDDNGLSLRFGGGLNTRANLEEINPAECADGENFELVFGNSEFRPRSPFDLIAQVPNQQEIRGFGTLMKSDGTYQTFVQAGATVYEWDGGQSAGSFTEIATVNPGARLRGRLEHNWQLTDELLVSDLARVEVVHKWDGTDFEAINFLRGDGSTPFGTFRAKYIQVENERALFGNVQDASGGLPHLIVGSQRGDYTIISNADRPASSLSAEDPFFIPQPELRPINGMAQAFGLTAISAREGSMFRLEGSSAEDFALSSLYPRSAATGDETVVFVGNDIVFGRPGALESLKATDQFGDVATADLSVPIQPSIEDVTSWTICYNSRTQRIYCFPFDRGEVWVAQKQLMDGEVSPWSRWTTRNSLDFRPTTVLNGIDPQDGLEYVFMGDALGNLYRMEGIEGAGDGGTEDIRATRTSKAFSMQMDAQIRGGLDAYAKYRKSLVDYDLNVTVMYAGERLWDATKTLGLTKAEGSNYYGGDVFYGGDYYYGTKFLGRLSRRTFQVPGGTNEFQIRTTVDGQENFAVSEIGFRFETAS